MDRLGRRGTFLAAFTHVPFSSPLPDDDESPTAGVDGCGTNGRPHSGQRGFGRSRRSYPQVVQRPSAASAYREASRARATNTTAQAIGNTIPRMSLLNSFSNSEDASTSGNLATVLRAYPNNP